MLVLDRRLFKTFYKSRTRKHNDSSLQSKLNEEYGKRYYLKRPHIEYRELEQESDVCIQLALSSP
jgi:hypothetical protein